MPAELVAHLRNITYMDDPAPLCRAAADEIERLRKLDALRQQQIEMLIRSTVPTTAHPGDLVVVTVPRNTRPEVIRTVVESTCTAGEGFRWMFTVDGDAGVKTLPATTVG